MPERLARAAPILVAALAGAIFAAGVGLGSHAASGSDAYGYVSQARLWRHGSLRQPEPLARTAGWPDAALALAPLGYRPAPGRFANVPTYAPGLPLLMALAALVGGACAVYLVVPLCSALLVVLAYRLARRASDPLVAAGAAMLTATCPAFLFMTMWPMTDVPVSVFWLASIVSASSEDRRGRPLLTAGLIAVAILIRPNLAPIAMVPIALSIHRASAGGRAATIGAALRLAAGVAPVVVAVALLNFALYGSPFESGYGAVSGLYSAGRVPRNAALHARWLLQSQGWFLLAMLPGLVVHLRRGARSVLTWSAAFAVCVWAAYLPYHTYTEWWYLRFLLPALPILFALEVEGIAVVTAPFGPAVRSVITAIFVIAASVHAFGFARDNGVFAIGEDEQRYVEVGAYLAASLPQDAVVFAGQHSGSVRYYAGRETIRYDRLRRDSFDAAVRALEAQHRHPYAVLDVLEEPLVRAHFTGQASLARLASPPIATLDSRIAVHVFDLSAGVPAGAPPEPHQIPHIARGRCVEPEP